MQAVGLDTGLTFCIPAHRHAAGMSSEQVVQQLPGRIAQYQQQQEEAGDQLPYDPL